MDFTPNERIQYRLQKGDVLLSEASGSPDEVGKPAIWNEELDECCFQNTVIQFRPTGVTSKFAHVIFQHYARNGVFTRTGKGVGIHHLSAARFSELPFPKPPSKTAEDFTVAKIEELLPDLDSGMSALERAKTNVKRYRTAVIKAAVEGKLTEQWRSDNPDVEAASELLKRMLAERRRKWEEAQLAKFEAQGKKPPKRWRERYEEPAPPDATNLPPLSPGWCWTTIDQCAADEEYAITDGPFGSYLKTAHYTDDGPRVVRLQNIGDGLFVDEDAHISVEHYSRLTRHAVHAGDVVTAMLGNRLPRACVIPPHVPPAIVKADCVKIAPHRAVVNSTWLVIAMNSEAARLRASSQIAGVGRPRLNLEKLRPLVLPLPPVSEQSSISAEVERRFSLLAQTIADIDTSLLRATRLRQSILKRAFEGKLVPQELTNKPSEHYVASTSDQKVATPRPPRRSRSPHGQRRTVRTSEPVM